MIPVRAVLFDVGGTLAEMPEVAFDRRIATALGLDATQAALVSTLVLRSVFTSAHALAERLQAELGLPDESTSVVRELWEAERTGLLEIPDATTCVAAIASAGAKVGILANLSSPGVEGFRIACPGIVSWIDTWGISCERGSTKPSAAAFQGVLDALGVAPAATLMVGDSLERDVAPALALGMSAVWLRRAEAAPARVVAVDPHAASFPVPAEVVPEGAVVARTLSDVRRIALTWLWAGRGPHGLTAPLAL
jgi:FMN phosphatase YigB (HAD superfamily)